MTSLNEKINCIIKANMVGSQGISFLTELLNISRESAYRRLRNEVSYTVNETYILSTKLNFSLDEIFREMDDHVIERSSSSSNGKELSPADNYINMMRSTIKAFDIKEEGEYARAFS